jgi:hypothetical protein
MTATCPAHLILWQRAHHGRSATYVTNIINSLQLHVKQQNGGCTKSILSSRLECYN